jgi:hypothetical protein
LPSASSSNIFHDKFGSSSIFRCNSYLTLINFLESGAVLFDEQ